MKAIESPKKANSHSEDPPGYFESLEDCGGTGKSNLEFLNDWWNRNTSPTHQDHEEITLKKNEKEKCKQECTWNSKPQIERRTAKSSEDQTGCGRKQKGMPVNANSWESWHYPQDEEHAQNMELRSSCVLTGTSFQCFGERWKTSTIKHSKPWVYVPCSWMEVGYRGGIRVSRLAQIQGVWN